MYRGLQVAVVIPAFQEEQLIGQTVTTVPRWVDHLLVVDDGSTDATGAHAVEAAVGRTGFELLCLPVNQGVGAAICAGYRRCLELQVDAAVVMGADAQMDPADLDRLLDPLADGRFGYAKGNRLGWPGVVRTMPTIRWLGNWALTWLTRPVSGCWRITDSQCGYTAISRVALGCLPLSRIHRRYGYPNDLLAWLNQAGIPVIDVPVRPIYGQERSGIHPVRIVWPMLRLLARIFGRRLWHRLRMIRLHGLRALRRPPPLEQLNAPPVTEPACRLPGVRAPTG